MRSKFGISTFLGAALLLSARAALAAPFTFNVDGVITNSNNQPLEAPAVTFRIEVKNTNESCVLYREDFNVNMSGSNGYFSIAVGKQSNAVAGGSTLEKVFSNLSTAIPGESCSHTPADANESRKIIVSFNDGVTAQVFSSQEVESVPFALEAVQAHKIGGYGTGELLKVDAAVNQTGGNFNQAQYDELLRLINNPLSAYLTSIPTLGGDVSGTLGAVSVDKIKNYPVVTPNIATDDGKVLTFNSVSGWTLQAAGTAPVDASYTAKGIVKFDTDAATSGIDVATGVAKVNTGTGPNQIIKLDGSSKLPAVDGSQLTGVIASDIADNTVTSTKIVDGTIVNADISGTAAIAWSKIASPTTLSGYGITDAVKNNGNTPGVSAGNEGSQPGSPTTGELYIAVDSGKIYRWSGAAWDVIATKDGGVSNTADLANGKIWVGNASGKAVEVNMSGDATIDNAGVLTLKSVGTAGNYFKVTTDAQGRVTAGSALTAADLIAALGYTPVSRAGDTMAGALNMGGFDITNSGDIHLAAGKYLGLADNNTAGTVEGQVWYDNGKIKYYDGSSTHELGVAGAGITSFNGATQSTQTVAAIDLGTSVTSPAWTTNTGTGVHTLKIPMASDAGVSAGLLSKTDHTTFSNKLTSPLTTKGDVLVFDGSNHVRLPVGADGQTLVADSAQGAGLKWTTLPAAGITDLTGDITATGPGSAAATIGAGKVTSNHILDGTIVGADMDFTGVNIAASNIVIKDSTGKFYEFGCATVGHVATWTVTGWTCQAPATAAVSNVASLADGNIWVGNASSKAAEVTLSGDATISNTGALTLASTITAGTKGDAQKIPQITYDAKGRLTSVSEVTVDDTTKLPLAGGSMSGNLNMGGQKITNLTNVPNVAANPAVGDDGKSLRWNNTSGQWEWFTPAAAGAGITSLNGQSGNSQSFGAIDLGTSVTAPAWSSASDIHTLKIPMASDSGVTAGLLSKTDYDKIGTVADGYVTSAKVADGTIVNADINASAAIDASKIHNGSISNTEFGYLDGASSNIQTQIDSKLTSPLTAKGDLLIRDGSNHVRLPVGTDGQTLVADSTQSAGLKWTSLPAAGITDLTGDITATGPGSATATIGAGKVTSNHILDGTIVGADMDFTGVNIAASNIVIKDNTGKFYEFGCATVGHVATWTVTGWTCQAPATAAVSNVASLGSGNIWVGNASGKAEEVLPNTHFIMKGGQAAGAALNLGTTDNYVLNLLVNNDPTMQLYDTGASVNGFLDITETESSAYNPAEASSNTPNGGSSLSIINYANSNNSAAYLKLEVQNASTNDQHAYIGTTSVAGLSARTPAIVFGQSTGINASTEAMRIDPSQNVGIGTIAPITKLDVNGITRSTGVDINSTYGGSQVRLRAPTTFSTYSLTFPDSAPAVNQMLQSDAAGKLSWVNPPSLSLTSGDITTALGYTPLNRAGATMSGALNMGTNDISNTGSISMADNKYFGLSNYTGATGSAAGQMWYDGGVIKYYNGSTAVTLGVAGAGITNLNGSTAANQTFMTGTAGNAPAWSFNPGAGQHTLNIPMAAASGSVTAGLISNADYSTMMSKQSNALVAGKIWVGNASGGAQAFSLTGDITSVSNAGVVTVNKTTTGTANTIVSTDGTGTIDAYGYGIKGTTSGTVDLLANANSANYSLRFPAAAPANGQMLQSNGSGVLSWVDGLTATSGFSNGGNSFGTNATLGTNDGFDLNIETNGTTRMVFKASGNVGIGVANPSTGSQLHVEGGAITAGPTGASAGNSGELRMMELTASGTNYVAFKAPDTLGANVVWRLPAADGSVNQVLATNGSGVLSWITAGGADNLGNHTATQNIVLGSNWLSGDGGNEGLRVDGSGNVGIGTASPTSKLDVSGSIQATGGQVTASQNEVASGATVDFNTGNVQILTAPGGSSITLQNMKDGGSYTVIIADPTARMYIFPACTNSRFVPDNDVTLSGKQTIYNILKVTIGGATHCYISWVTGF